MGRIDAIIDDNVISEFKIAIIKRLGGKKGDFSKALEQAMELWCKQDVLNNLKEAGMKASTITEMLDTVKTIKTYGKVGIFALSELLKKDGLSVTENKRINSVIRELSMD